MSLSLTDRAAVRGQLLYPVNALPEFGGLRDAAPDAWGRRVIEARRKVPANTLSEADYLLGAGGDRVGALDVREALDKPARPSASDLQSLGYLLQAAEAVEAGVPVPAHLMDVLGAGPSAGGARPKATVRDDEGGLWLAKFPAHNDAFDVARAETCTLELARRCGLTVPEVRHRRYWQPLRHGSSVASTVSGPTRESIRPRARCMKPGPVSNVPNRAPLLSAGLPWWAARNTSLPTKAMATWHTPSVVTCNPGRIARDNEELFARMVFNIFVSNDDDHLRNHGFIRDPRVGGWQLSPLYDVVPRPGVAYERHLHLHIGAEGKAATLDNALSRYTAFLSDRAAAISVIRRVWGEVRQWKTVFESFGAPGLLIDQVVSAFRPLEEIASPSLIKELRLRR